MGQTVSEHQPIGLTLTFPVMEVLAETRSAFQKIGFYRTEPSGVVFLLDDAVMVTERDEFVYHEMITNVPLFSHSAPRRVLIVGGGDLGAARECLKHQELLEVHTCEIDGDVVELSRKFLPWVPEVLADPRNQVTIADGWDFLRRTEVKGRYDVILMDLSDAIGLYKTDHAARLFTPEFFQLLTEALTPDGIIAGQCESAFYHADFIAAIRRELSGSFPQTHNFTATIPTYPGGLWCFYFASRTRHPLQDFRADDARRLASSMGWKYYTADIHRAAFALPAALERAIRAPGRP